MKLKDQTIEQVQKVLRDGQIKNVVVSLDKDYWSLIQFPAIKVPKKLVRPIFDRVDPDDGMIYNIEIVGDTVAITALGPKDGED